MIDLVQAVSPLTELLLRQPLDDVDACHSQVAAAGPTSIEPIWDAPWGLRQLSVLNPVGNPTTFHAA